MNSAEIRDGDLVVQWSGDGEVRYPLVWLRDNCQCSTCFSPTSKSRDMLLSQLDIDVNIKKYQIDDQGAAIAISWDDDHESSYDFAWLRERNFKQETRDRRKLLYSLKPVTWDASDKSAFRKIPFRQVIEDDLGLYKWLCTLEAVGICILTDAPQEPGQIAKLGERAGFLRKCNYGETFSVTAKPNPQHSAYTGVTLGLHTDQSFYEYQPGMQMLHCIKQIAVEGGDNQFSDGFNVAKQLKESSPDDYKLLSDVIVDFRDIGVESYEFFQMNRIPILSHDEEGNLHRVSFSNISRDSFLNIPYEQIKPFYRAMKKYNDLLYSDRNCIKIKLNEGDIACFHNYRVLHGRTGWKKTEHGSRHLEGSYIDWDELKSCRRVLQKKFKEPLFA